MTTLEQINGETCARKIRAMRQAEPDEELEHCRNCEPNRYKECEHYHPISQSGLLIRKGNLAYKLGS